MTKEEAINIINATLQLHYPEISIKHVRVHFVRGKDYYMQTVWQLLWHALYIDRLALKLPPKAFQGCLAHELSHIILFKRTSFLSHLNQFFGPLDKTNEERETDYHVVSERGLGESLLAFHKEHNKKYKPYKESEGLTTAEIKKIMKSL